MEKLHNGGIYTEVDVDMDVNDEDVVSSVEEDVVEVVSGVEEDVVAVVSNVKVALEEDMRGRDNSDEPLYKAATAGLHTFLINYFRLFLVATTIVIIPSSCLGIIITKLIVVELA